MAKTPDPNVQYPLVLGESFKAFMNGDKKRKAPENVVSPYGTPTSKKRPEFLSMQFESKPASIDLDDFPGTLSCAGPKYTLRLDGDAPGARGGAAGHAVFEGLKPEAKSGVQCVVIFEGDRWVLEHVGTRVAKLRCTENKVRVRENEKVVVAEAAAEDEEDEEEEKEEKEEDKEEEDVEEEEAPVDAKEDDDENEFEESDGGENDEQQQIARDPKPAPATRPVAATKKLLVPVRQGAPADVVDEESELDLDDDEDEDDDGSGDEEEDTAGAISQTVARKSVAGLGAASGKVQGQRVSATARAHASAAVMDASDSDGSSSAELTSGDEE